MIILNQNIAQNTPLVKVETKNIVRHFNDQEKKNPYQVAIIEKRQSITYLELKTGVLETANYFLSAGIKRGDRVLVFVPMSISLYRIVLALFHIGATAVFLDEWSTQERLKKACEVADCKGFIGNWKAKALGIFTKQIRRIPIWLSINGSSNRRSYTKPVEVDQMSPALITFTTGSTGIPKAADRTHYFLNAQMEVLNGKLDMPAGMIDMPALPIFVLLNLGNGLVSVLPEANMRKPASIDISKIIKQLEEHGVERIIASPFLIKAISNFLIDHNINLPSLKEVYTGGAPIFPDDAALFVRAFGDIRMEAVYGSTEAEPISSIKMSSLATSEISNGLPVGEVASSTNLKVIAYRDSDINSQDFEKIQLGKGEVGEIVVSGIHVLKAYFKNPEAIRRNKIMHNNSVWHRTGDAGYVDENGDLCLVGRCEQLIYLNGKMYSPFLYAYLLQQVNGVSLGTILEKKGQLIVVLETEGNLDKDALENIFANEDFKLVTLPKIPRDPRHNSKIDFGKLELMVKA